MIQLQLSDDERRVLADVLETVVADLGMEIADTDTKDFREVLKVRKQALIKVLEAIKK